MSTNDNEAVISLFRTAQDALLGAFQWGMASNGKDNAQQTADRLIQSQEMAVRMMSAMTGAWVEMAKRGMVGPDGVRTFMEKFGTELPLMGSALPNAEAFKAMTEQWRKSGQQLLELTHHEAVPEAFKQMLAGFGSSPGFGLTREYQAKLNRTFDAWLDFQQRDLEYRTLLSKAWTDSFGRVMEKMAERATKGDGPQTAREALEDWIKVADETFVGLFKTDEFSQAQSGLMNASMVLKKHRRELVEDALSANDLPTRKDVEEAHRMIYSLRKELKAVKKQLADLAAAKSEGSHG